MNELTVFQNEQFGQVRTTIKDGEPWFVAADVCRALEVKNARDAVARLDEDEKGVALTDTLGGQQNVTIVNEPGLYALVLGSRKPEARAFKRWITHEVIPSIRKSGGYIAGQESMSDADLMAKALLVAQRQIEQREKQLTEMKPKALFADAVSASKTSILIGELAKLLRQNGVSIGQNSLFQYMRDNGYLCNRGAAYNCPPREPWSKGCLRSRKPLSSTRTGMSPSAERRRSRARGRFTSSTDFWEARTMFNPKPCPLCGEATLETWRSIIAPTPRRYQIVCATCYYCGRKALTKWGAVWKWNREKVWERVE